MNPSALQALARALSICSSFILYLPRWVMCARQVRKPTLGRNDLPKITEAGSGEAVAHKGP